MSKIEPKSRPVLYKVTRDGLSPYAHYQWSLPANGKPGDWHEASPDPLIQHKNGFHLTSDPNTHWRGGMEVWLVETEGEVLYPYEAKPSVSPEDEYVARKVRLVRRLRPADLDKLNVGVERTYRRAGRSSNPRKRDPQGDSPLVQILALFNDHAIVVGSRKGGNLVNEMLNRAWELCVEAQFEFGIDDFKKIAAACDLPGLASEYTYAALIRTGNISGCKAWEAWQRRTPWMWQGERLHCKAKLPWGGRICTITSISDGDETITACAYKAVVKDDRGYSTGPAKIDKRYTITREALRNADKARKSAERWLEAAKSTAVAVFGEKRGDSWRDPGNQAAPSLCALVAVWTQAQQDEALEWAWLCDTDKGKTRFAVPPEPSFVAMAREDATTHDLLEEALEREYGEALEARNTGEPFPAKGIVSGTAVCTANDALRRWAEAAYDGHPADYRIAKAVRAHVPAKGTTGRAKPKT